ncbi:MAG: glutamate synthase, partial [Clostridia bacterium]|nr:glutamate synthase [Clostridia bacterium]
LVLGKTGRNFAAGMSGGVAYVFDGDGSFTENCNQETVHLEPLDHPQEEMQVKELLQKHVERTGSPLGQRMLQQWSTVAARIVRVMPMEYERYLARQAKEVG